MNQAIVVFCRIVTAMLRLAPILHPDPKINELIATIAENLHSLFQLISAPPQTPPPTP